MVTVVRDPMERIISNVRWYAENLLLLQVKPSLVASPPHWSGQGWAQSMSLRKREASMCRTRTSETPPVGTTHR